MPPVHCQCCLDELVFGKGKCTFDKAIVCLNPSCDMGLCHECSQRLIEISVRDREIAACGCKEPLLFSQIQSVLKCDLLGLENQYSQILVKQLTNKNENELHAHLLRRRILDKLKKEKVQHMRTLVVGSLQLTIEYAFSDRLQSVQVKNIEKAMEQEVNVTKRRRCHNSLCDGFLDKLSHANRLQCSACAFSCCSLCEKKITLKSDGAKHICSQEDLDSLSAVLQCVQCPLCNIPVIKSSGCNNMTCAICKTNFDYITGKVCEFGNHDPLQIHMTQDDLDLYRIVDLLLPKSNLTNDHKFLLQQLQSHRPKPFTFQKILSLLTKRDVCLKGISKAYEKYKRSQYSIQMYFRFLEQIYESIRAEKSYQCLDHLRLETLQNELRMMSM